MGFFLKDLGVRWTLARETGFAMVSRLSPKAASTLVFVLLLRRSGAADAGVYTLAVALVTAVVLLTSLGLDELILREVAQTPEASYRYLVNGVLLRVLLALVGYGFLALLLLVLGYGDAVRQVILIQAVAILPESVMATAFAVFAANRLIRYSAIVSSCASALQLLMGAWAIATGAGLVVIAWTVVAGSWVGALASAYLAYRLAAGRREPVASGAQMGGVASLAQCKELIVRASPFFLLIGLVSVDLELDVIVLSKLGSVEDVGWYGAARSLVLLFSILAQSLRMAIYPLMSKAYVTSKAALRQVYLQSWSYVALAGLPIAVGGMFISKDLLSLVYRHESATAVWALRILFGFLLANFLYQPGTRLLVVADRQMQLAGLLGVSIVVHLGSSLLLTPRYGAVGAAVARSLASLVYFAVVEWHVDRNVLRRGLPIRFLGVLLLSTAGMAGLLVITAAQPWYVRVLLGGAGYGILVGLLGGSRIWRTGGEAAYAEQP